MPTQVDLYRISTKEKRSWQDVDNELRAYFDQPPDDEHWLWGWYDAIGVALAMGATFESLMQGYASRACWNGYGICSYLADNYTTDIYKVWKH